MNALVFRRPFLALPLRAGLRVVLSIGVLAGWGLPSSGHAATPFAAAGSAAGGAALGFSTHSRTMPTLPASGLSAIGSSSPLASGAAGIGGPAGGSSLQPVPPLPGSTSGLGHFSIQLHAGPNLLANGPALAAFQRAAQQWESYISDPVSVVINAEITPLEDDEGMPNTTTIGEANSALVQGTFNEVRDLMVLDAADEPDDGIVGSLPTADEFSAFVPVDIPVDDGSDDDVTADFELGGNTVLTRANAKALQPGALPASPFSNNADAQIEFNSNFDFDYDNSDGVGAGLFDFETTAAHEIGHALGFVTAVDEVDFVASTGWQDPTEDPSDPELDFPNPYEVSPRPLDLFRFLDEDSPDDDLDPADAGEFTTFPRWLVPLPAAAGIHVFDQIDASTHGPAEADAELPLSAGLFFGNGRQAGHWFPDEQDAMMELIGLFDPSLGPGGGLTPSVMNISGADLRALDLIGWDIGQVPEPASGVLLGLASVGFLGRRRRGGALSHGGW